MLSYISQDEQRHFSLRDIAYTFQVGREAMDNRIVFIVNDLEEWKHQLEAFVTGKPLAEGCIQGEKRE